MGNSSESGLVCQEENCEAPAAGACLESVIFKHPSGRRTVLCQEHLEACYQKGHCVELWNPSQKRIGQGNEGKGKASGSAAASRSNARLERAWQLFMALVVRRHDRADPACCAMETVERAMGVWEDYERRRYGEAPPPPSQGLSDRLMRSGFYEPFPAPAVPGPPAQEAVSPEPPPPPYLPPDLSGWWITRGGRKVELKSGCGQEYPYGAIDDSPGKFAGVLYDSAGNAFSGPTRGRVPDYDLEERVLPGSAPPSTAAAQPQPPPKPPLDFSGRWITRGGALVGVVSTTRGKFPYAGGLYGEGGQGSGLLWNSEGLAVGPYENKPAPEYDLMERAPSPGGHRMDYPPEDLKKEA